MTSPPATLLRPFGALLFVLVSALTALTGTPLPAHAAPAIVPEPLRSWQDWVMQDHESLRCPVRQPPGDARTCMFAGTLRMDIADTGATFSINASVRGNEALLPLPGEAGVWPTGATVDGRAAIVVAHEGRPVVSLTPGSHTVTGRLAWRQMPARLWIAPLYASVDVQRNGAAVLPDAAGYAWLGQQGAGAGEANSERLRTFRLLSDDIPFRVDTRFELQVSGAARAITLPLALLPGFDALSVDADLPTRFDGQGGLVVQARAGRHVITVSGQLASAAQRLDLPAGSADEIWSFEAHSALRRADVQGAQAIDPRQAGVPEPWQALPAWHVAPGDGLTFTERTRGDSAPAPDRLSLSRRIWLDADGGGMSYQDRIGGTVTRSWRLSARAPMAPGRVSLNGQDQYITRLGDDDAPGVEVRQGSIDMVADGRIARPDADIPATGWSADFEQVSAQLQLPPGWRLLHASGADSVSGAWLARWSLWDFFFVLLIGAAALRVFGAATAAVLGVALVMSWHLPTAPGWLWLAVIAFSALERSAVTGRLGRHVARARLLALIVLAGGLLSFAVEQAREAIYPAMEFPYLSAGDEQTAGAGEAAPAPAPAPMASQRKLLQRYDERALDAASSVASAYEPKQYAAVDPDARVQTGPGLPNWQWRGAQLEWTGPVRADQSFRLWLSPPLLTRCGTVLMLVLMGAALWLVAGRPRHLPRLFARGGQAGAAVLLALALLQPDPAGAAAPAAPPTEAPSLPGPDTVPSRALLDELRERITAPPRCAPDCAHINTLTLSARGNRVMLRMDIHVRGPVVLPLPGSPAWRQATNTLSDGTPELARDDDGSVWIHLTPGIHTLTRTLAADTLSSVQVALPAPVGAVTLDLDGWSASGMDAAGTVGDTLLLTRMERGGTDASTSLPASSDIAPSVRVTRALVLGQRWRVNTTIERVGQGRAPIDVAVTLLDGEAVTDPGVAVAAGVATITLPEGRGAHFSADLAQQDRLVLTAPARPRHSEVWTLDISPSWHATLDGIAPVLRSDQGNYLPRWQPWPGETLTIAVTRPQGVSGPTITMDKVALTVRPGRQASDVAAEVTMRSSLGGTHRLALPAGAELLGFSIDGEAQPVYLENGAVPVPLRPGTRQVTLSWRQPDALSTWYVPPRIDLGQPAVNAVLQLEVPPDRWVLFAGGPTFGPAVLFWGVAVVLVLAAAAVSRLRLVPLSTPAWILLAIGAGQGGVSAAVFVGGFLLLMGVRERYGARLRPLAFNLMQIALLVLALMAVDCLFDALRNGLLGQPGMMIAGNGSSDHWLRWYADRIDGPTPDAWLLSVPLWVWRGLMLLWALWLATRVIAWSQWVWQAWSQGGAWKKGALARKPAPVAAADNAEPPPGAPPA
jgi:hypothetical protein